MRTPAEAHLRTAALGWLLATLAAGACTRGQDAQPATAGYQNGIVVSGHRLASQAGIEILQQGGNAVDAAIAVSYALAVVLPEAGNIGGGGFLVLRRADGFATTIDYREKAPGAAHRDMYLDEHGNVITRLTRDGALAVGVPGTVAGTLYALEKYGGLDRRRVLAPAIRLADEGWILDVPMGGGKFKMFEESNAVFNKPDGSRYEAGERWVQKDLAATLRTIAEHGRDGFYKGRVADRFVATMRKYDGIITHEDLAGYDCVERAPVTGMYRGYGIVSMPPPSSGGISLIEMLNMLEGYDVRALGYNTADAVHLMIEVERRVFADRAQYIADPDFYDVPQASLLSKAYARRRAAGIDMSAATPSTQVRCGDPEAADIESRQTTHYSVVDKDGMAVAVTTTLEGSYGSHLVVGGAGFLLNNEMGDFSAKTGVPNTAGLVYGQANAVEPNKRMLSSMTPTIVTENGRLFVVVGTPGGPTIITTVLQCLINIIDHDMTIDRAVAAARFHHQWLPDAVEHEKEAFSDAAAEELKRRGHLLKDVKRIGNVQAVVVDPQTGVLTGFSDPRGRGAALGY